MKKPARRHCRHCRTVLGWVVDGVLEFRPDVEPVVSVVIRDGQGATLRGVSVPCPRCGTRNPIVMRRDRSPRVA